MAEGMVFEIEGVEELMKKLRKGGPEILREAGAALYQEAQIERTESMRRTPVDTGALKASHAVKGPDFSPDGVSAKIEVGGPSTPYAIYVHENLEAYHTNGQAKFLESTLNESRPFLASRIAKRIDLNRAIK